MTNRVWQITALVMAFALGFVFYLQRRTAGEQAMLKQDQLRMQTAAAETNQQLAALRMQSEALAAHYTELKTQNDLALEKLGITQKQLAQARVMARQMREQNEQADQQILSKIEDQGAQLGTLNTEVVQVKGTVQEARTTIDTTVTRLDKAIGDLGVQSGLIARNHDELEELRRRGEREYVELSLVKSRKFQRVGEVAIRLARTDRKRQKYTVALLVDDKQVEKKDKTALEPVQFYRRGSHQLMEVVVFDVQDGRVTGYLSMPKHIAMNR